MGEVLVCNKELLVQNSNYNVPINEEPNENNNNNNDNKNNLIEIKSNNNDIQIKEDNNLIKLNSSIPKINFDNLYTEISQSDIISFQNRIETYELKGFNSLTANIKPSNNKPKLIKIHKLFNKDLIDNNNLYLRNISQQDINIINSLKHGHMKHKEVNFYIIDLDNINLNKYGNINLINVIIGISKINKNYLKKMFLNFDIENGNFDINLYKNGKKKLYKFDNKIIKNTLFIHPYEKNFWIYLIEKGIAKLCSNYINSIRLLSSEIFPMLLPCELNEYNHYKINKKVLYEIIKNNLSNSIIFTEKDINENYNEINYISFYVNRVFKYNNKKYIELYLPFNKANNDNNNNNKEIKIENVIDNEIDLKIFNNINNNHFIYYKYDHFYKKFNNTFILKYYPKNHYQNKTIILSDSNINLLKFKINKQTKITISFYFPFANILRIILCKLNIIENYIRHVKTMSSYAESNSYYTDELNYKFDFIKSFFLYEKKLSFNCDLDEGIYCLLFNAYINSEIKINIGFYSNEEIEIIENEKINEDKFNSQIKSLFVSYIKNNLNNNNNNNNKIEKKIIKDENAIEYFSLLNENLGYSIILIENNSDNFIIDYNLLSEVDGMNLITKEYNNIENVNNLNNINIKIPPKNFEVIIFEWEKLISNVFINVVSRYEINKIELIFNKNNIYEKKYLIQNFVYYQEIQYKNGVYLIFVNESNFNYNLNIFFEKFENLEYKGFKEIKGKFIKFGIKSFNYKAFKLECINDEIEYEYKMKITGKKVNDKKEEIEILLKDEENNNVNNNNLIDGNFTENNLNENSKEKDGN